MDFTLESIANIAEVVGACSIITGLIFGLFQLNQFRLQQRDVIACDLAKTFQDQKLATAISLIQTLPDNISLEDLRAEGEDYTNACVCVTTSFETMGLLVFRHIAPFDLVMDLAGGIVITMNRKLLQANRDLREELDQPSWAEWFEWLADQISKSKTMQEPAHILHRDWQA